MNYRLRNDEVVTGATFLLNDLQQDRKAIEEIFSEINVEYQEDFVAQITTVKKLDSKYAKNKQQTEASQKLYNFSGKVNTQMNALSLKCKRAGVDTSLISTIKKKLHTLDIEGAYDDITDLSKTVKDKIEVLMPKGVKENYPETLLEDAEMLLQLNSEQNMLISQNEKLTEANQKEYNKLRDMITYIMSAGKITFSEQKKRKNYTMSYLVERMRSNNQKDDDDTDTQ